MDKQHKNICVYAMALFLVAAILIILSSILQNRITKQQEEQLKSNLTTDITTRLQKNMQQNIDDITTENTKLKSQLKQDKEDITSLKNQINDLNKLVADKEITDTQNKNLQQRYETISSDLGTALKYYKQGRLSSAKKTLVNLESIISSWDAADKATAQANASQSQNTSSDNDTNNSSQNAGQ